MRLSAFMLIIGIVLLTSIPVLAHFGVVVPSDDIVSGTDAKTITLELKFIHPFEGTYMEMARPKAFGLLRGSSDQSDLLGTLTKKSFQEKTYWQTSYRIRRPGDHVFFMEPIPYWEPAEEKFIVHYTKVIVNALGLEEGWDAEVGLPVEIIPLTRPYGLWAGNVFQGVVRNNGKPLPFAEVEVEYLNSTSGGVTAPADPFITQVIRADANGVFTYAMPREGWWGFAALTEADYTLKHKGKDHSVELGAVIWIRTHKMGGR